MHHYVAYGLSIHSALPLPELQASAEATADVVVRREKIDRLPPGTDPGKTYFHVTPQEAYFLWEGVGAFLVRGGREVLVDPIAGAEERVIRLPLLGAVLAVLLHQRGFLVLHASAVAVEGGGVAFLGAKGWGKSTMAAALYARGHCLIADDVVALDVDGAGDPMLLPGFPQLKLWPEAAASSMGDDPESLPRLHPQVEKRSRRITDGFSQQRFPLRRIYLLAESPTPAIEPLPPREAILQLISHSYSSRFGKQLLQGREAASHFRQCARLTGQLPVCWLKRHLSLEALPALARMVEEDLSRTRRVDTGAGSASDEA
jgi:hypothetical protein